VAGSFQLLKQRRDLSVVPVQHLADTRRKRPHYKSLCRLRLFGSYQSLPQQTVHSSLERLARPLHLLLQEMGNVVVESESSPHIMMLGAKTS